MNRKGQKRAEVEELFRLTIAALDELVRVIIKSIVDACDDVVKAGKR